MRVRARTSAGAVGTPAGASTDLVIAEGAARPNSAGEAATALDLDDQRGHRPAAGRHPGEGGADRRFADAALPGDDEDPGRRAERPWIHPLSDDCRMTCLNDLPEAPVTAGRRARSWFTIATVVAFAVLTALQLGAAAPPSAAARPWAPARHRQAQRPHRPDRRRPRQPARCGRPRATTPSPSSCSSTRPAARSPPPALDARRSRIVHSPVPVAVWVGGSGRPRAYGGRRSPCCAAPTSPERRRGSLVGKGPPPPQTEPDGLEHRTMSGDDAVDAHLLASPSPTLVDFLGDLSGTHTIEGVHLGTSGRPTAASARTSPSTSASFVLVPSSCTPRPARTSPS